MKQSTNTTIVTIAKKLTVFAANLGIFTCSFASIASLVLLLGQFDLTEILPKGTVMTFSGYDAWGGVNALVATLVASNTLMTYGFIKLKAFAKNFQETDLFEASTVSFLRKGALLMVLVGTIQAATEFIISPTHIVLSFPLAGWLFIASLVLSYIQANRASKIA